MSLRYERITFIWWGFGGWGEVKAKQKKQSEAKFTSFNISEVNLKRKEYVE